MADNIEKNLQTTKKVAREVLRSQQKNPPVISHHPSKAVVPTLVNEAEMWTSSTARSAAATRWSILLVALVIVGIAVGIYQAVKNGSPDRAIDPLADKAPEDQIFEVRPSDPEYRDRPMSSKDRANEANERARELRNAEFRRQALAVPSQVLVGPSSSGDDLAGTWSIRKIRRTVQGPWGFDEGDEISRRITYVRQGDRWNSDDSLRCTDYAKVGGEYVADCEVEIFHLRVQLTVSGDTLKGVQLERVLKNGDFVESEIFGTRER